MLRPINLNLRENAEKRRDQILDAAESMVDFFGKQGLHAPLGQLRGGMMPFRVDAIETETTYEIFAELPGFHKDQIKVSYDESSHRLKIAAEREEPDMSIRYICHDRRSGSFERIFEVDDIDTAGTSVSLEDGVLHVVLPKAPEEEANTVFEIK